MKKILTLMLAAAILLTAFTACSSGENATTAPTAPPETAATGEPAKTEAVLTPEGEWIRFLDPNRQTKDNREEMIFYADGTYSGALYQNGEETERAPGHWYIDRSYDPPLLFREIRQEDGSGSKRVYVLLDREDLLTADFDARQAAYEEYRDLVPDETDGYSGNAWISISDGFLLFSGGDLFVSRDKLDPDADVSIPGIWFSGSAAVFRFGEDGSGEICRLKQETKPFPWEYDEEKKTLSLVDPDGAETVYTVTGNCMTPEIGEALVKK